MSDSECTGAPQLKVFPKSNRCIVLVLWCNELLYPLTVLVLDLTGEVLWFARLLSIGEWMPLRMEQYAYN